MEQNTLTAREIKEQLIQALERMLSTFSPYPCSDTERWREEHEACEQAMFALAVAREEVS